MKNLKLISAFTACALLCGAAFAQTENPASDLGAASGLARGLSKLLNSPKSQENAESDADAVNASSDEVSRAALPIPQNAGVVLSAPSLSALDKTAAVFFKETSGTEFSALSTLRLTDYRRVLSALDVDAPIGLYAFCETAPPKFALVLPVEDKNFKSFVDALSQTAPKDVRSSSIAKDGAAASIALKLGDQTLDVQARKLQGGYAALALADDAALLDSFATNNLVRSASGLQPGLLEPSLSLEATPQGIRALTTPDRPFWREAENAMLGIEKELRDAQVGANLTEIRERLRQNLASVRVDAAIDDYGVYVATQTMPIANSAEAKRLASYGPLSPVNADADRFFTVLPDVEAPISGQTEISAELAKSLPKPFNRVKFAEFSLNLPLQSELAAESWQIFLEVDDANEFVKEMVIPRAREIGSYIGAKEAENAASQIFGALAERRRARQESRVRQPRRLADPEEAAARGAALGNLLGGAIGADSGEQSAMHQYKFDDYTMYISDLETYTRQSKLMQAEAQGTVQRQEKKLVFDRNRPLLSSLDVMLADVGSGESLQDSLLRSANEEAAKVDNTPLFARKANIVVLDKNHILFGLGNQQLLHLAVNNWKATSNPSIHYLTEVNDTDGIRDMQALCAKIPNAADSKFVSAIRLDLPRAQAYYKWLAQVYFPTAPALPFADLPDDTPNALVLSCVENSSEAVRVVAPHQTIAKTFTTIAGGKTPLQLLLQAKPVESDENSENAGEDLDDVFSE